MKVAVVYNRDSKNVINLFGQPNREKIGQQAIKRITDALKQGKHQPTAFEADKDLIDRLEEFMPRVVKGERPGLVFNISYGIQGQARYTHVPSILEMIGIPYVGSGPLAHSIALDKVITKMVLVQHGLPTPPFAVLEGPESDLPDLGFPVIVKPKHEAVSFGIRVCNNEDELREAAGAIFEMFGQSVLVEQFIEGREVNVGLLGNGVPDALPPVELSFACGGESVYSYEDKIGQSGRTIELLCPAPIDDALREQAQDLARSAFRSVGCFDCARVDMRLDEAGRLQILEVNSLPSLGPRGSYVRAAEEAGLDFAGLVNRLVEVASARYFGTPNPPVVVGTKDPHAAISGFVAERRDLIEKRLRHWVTHSSRTFDSIGLQAAAKDLEKTFLNVGLRSVPELTDGRWVQTWQSDAGMDAGTLLVAHADVPLEEAAMFQAFRREPEWLLGEGVATSRAPLVTLEFALRALRSLRLLRRRKVGVLIYFDEGRDCTNSANSIRAAMSRARRVLILRPGGQAHQVMTQRRGQRKYRLIVEGEPVRPGRKSRQGEVLVWFGERIGQIAAASASQHRLSVSLANVRSESFPMLLPHRLHATLLITFVDPVRADAAEASVRKMLGKGGPKWSLDLLSDRPPLTRRPVSRKLGNDLLATAAQWDIPLELSESVWPSVAGLAPESTSVLCGLGPEARDLYTPNEAVQRLSLIQRILLLGQFLCQSDGSGG